MVHSRDNLRAKAASRASLASRAESAKSSAKVTAPWTPQYVLARFILREGKKASSKDAPIASAAGLSKELPNTNRGFSSLRSWEILSRLPAFSALAPKSESAEGKGSGSSVTKAKTTSAPK